MTCFQKTFFPLVFLSLLSFYSKSQTCTSCTLHINTQDTSSYTIGSGQTLCLDSGAVISGNITLSGGTLCIKGIFNPASFTNNGGTIIINSYGVVILKNDVVIGAQQITVNKRGVLNVLGKLTLGNSQSNISSEGSLNISGNIVLNAGTINNSGALNYNHLESNGGSISGDGANNARN